MPAAPLPDRHFGQRRNAPVDAFRAWGMVVAIVIGCGLMTAAFLTQDRDLRSLSQLAGVLLIGPRLLGPLAVFMLLYYLPLERIAFHWNREANLAALRAEVEAEIAAAKQYRGGVRWPILLRDRRIATRYAPTHPITKEIVALVEEAQRHPWPEEDGALGREWHAVLHTLLFSGMAPLDRLARWSWVLSLPLLIASAVQSAPPIGLGGAGLLLHWVSLVVILRRQSGIIALGGSFLLTVVMLCVLIIASRAIAE